MARSHFFAHARRAGACALLAGLVGSASGCFFNSEGGAAWSFDRYTYVSTSWQPKTVSLVDTRTGETLWSVDIPIGQQLSLGFRQGAGPNDYKPDMMDWGLANAGTRGNHAKNRMPVPGRSSRRVDMAIRPTPEMPGSPMPGSPFDVSVDEFVPVTPDAGDAAALAPDAPPPTYTTIDETRERKWPIYTSVPLPPADDDN